MNEDKSQPNPDWVTVPFGIINGFEMRDGKWVQVQYKMQDGKIEEIPVLDNDDEVTQG
jgi:hypothetical protein